MPSSSQVTIPPRVLKLSRHSPAMNPKGRGVVILSPEMPRLHETLRALITEAARRVSTRDELAKVLGVSSRQLNQLERVYGVTLPETLT